MTEPRADKVDRDETKGERTRKKLVATTADLLQRQGYHATGLAQIVAESGAPRGSLYFYFPDGKDQLAVAALDVSSREWRARIDAAIDAAADLGQAAEAVCRLLADDLADSDYQRGCPVAAVALEAAATSGPVRKAVEGHYAEWSDAIVERLSKRGMARDQARQLATFMLAAVEGALLLAKVQRSREPLLVVGKMLRAMAALQPTPPKAKPTKAKSSASRG
ncbi:MAG TPA: TetR/AcrR family transcriptional regulator [Kofleriaceae bacterium]